MNPIIDIFSVDDDTVQSCEPSSLRAVMYAIRETASKMRKDRLIIKSISVRQEGEMVQDPVSPKMFTKIYTVHLGFYVKDEWHNSTARVQYYYAPNSVSNVRSQIEITKSAGEYPNRNDEMVFSSKDTFVGAVARAV